MKPVATLLTILALTLTYSILRYNVFGTVEWSQLPLYVVNKAVSWTGLTLLALAYMRRDKSAARDLGVLGAFLVGGHIVMSLAMLSPAYYAKLFDGPRLNGWGSGVVLAGLSAAVVLALPAIATLPGMHAALGEARWLRWQRAGYWTLALTAIHCALLGWKGWLTPGSWQGGLPPITLLSFLTAVAPLARKAVVRRGARG
jgi:DMSO/TMAO reductase YedYZ heme-binding membrane subunit